MSDSLAAIAGFRFAAVAAGIRKDGRIDLALATAERPVPTAARYTRNIVRAAPVLVAAERSRSGMAQAVLVNSGCANACTGEPGLRAARVTTAAIASALGCEAAFVLPASTGVIGAQLPADKIVAAVPGLFAAAAPDGLADFALAICTTDRWTKTAEAAVGVAGRVVGVAKGAGMIQPSLGRFEPKPSPELHATMLAFLFTDVVATPELLDAALEQAAERGFNSTSVDGDTSTNDTLIVMASGASGKTASLDELVQAFCSVTESLAESMARDGEGSEHVAELWVRGVASDADAAQIARTISTSLLVKTAMAGKDPNWGRWLAAAGRAGVEFDPAQARIAIDGVAIVQAGVAVGAEAETRAKQSMKGPRYQVELTLGDGPGKARYFMCDLGHEYVNVNADYRS